MKRLLLFSLSGLVLTAASAQTIIYQQSFDSLNSGDLCAQTLGEPWSTWSQSPGSTEDSPISNAQSSSAPNSLWVTGVPAGGPTDLILKLGDKTTGRYALSWKMFIPAGNGGYFNIQHNQIVGNGSWMQDVTFLPDGTIEFLQNQVTTNGTYTQDTWFDVIIALDLDAQTAAILIDDVVQTTWATGTPAPNQFGAIDFFGYAGGAPNQPSYYVDDILYMDLTGVGIEEEPVTTVTVGPNPTNDFVTVKIPEALTGSTVSLLDATGRTLLQRNNLLNMGGASQARIEMDALPAGLYFVRVNSREGEVVRRVVKN